MSRLPRLLSAVVDAAPDFALGVACLTALAEPGNISEVRRAYLAHGVLIEFLVIHCSGFLFAAWMFPWDTGRRALYVAALAAFYSLLAGGASLIIHDVWPLAIFWALMANRMLWVVVRQAPATEDFDFATHAWAGTTTLFLFAVFIGLPALGGFTPKAFLLTGFLYYTAVGLSELTGWRWMFSWMERARRRETSRPRRR